MEHPKLDEENYTVKRYLIVNYLPQNLNENTLHELFSPFGPLESTKIMRDKKTGYSFGFGFVNFVEEKDAQEAMDKLNGLEIENKKIKVSIAMPSSEFIKGSNLYISNLPRTITNEDLQQLFSPYGKIVQINVLRDRLSNLPKGVGFVRFSKREMAHSALQAMNNTIPQLPDATEPIRVKIAEDYGKQKATYIAGFKAGTSVHQRFFSHARYSPMCRKY